MTIHVRPVFVQHVQCCGSHDFELSCGCSQVAHAKRGPGNLPGLDGLRACAREVGGRARTVEGCDSGTSLVLLLSVGFRRCNDDEL